MADETPKKKRGRPRKNHAPPAAESTPAEPKAEVPDTVPEDIESCDGGAYAEEFTGRRWYYIGIKGDPEHNNELPFVNSSFGGVQFQMGTQRVIEAEEYMALDSHRQRVVPTLLSHSQVNRALYEIGCNVVRWSDRELYDDKGQKTGALSVRAAIVNLRTALPRVDAKSGRVVAARMRNAPQAGDVELSKYLVLAPRKWLEERDAVPAGTRGNFTPDVNSLPSIWELWDEGTRAENAATKVAPQLDEAW